MHKESKAFLNAMNNQAIQDRINYGIDYVVTDLVYNGWPDFFMRINLQFESKEMLHLYNLMGKGLLENTLTTIGGVPAKFYFTYKEDTK